MNGLQWPMVVMLEAMRRFVNDLSLSAAVAGFVAVLVGFAVLNLPLASVLKKNILAGLEHPPHEHDHAPAPFGQRLVGAMNAGVRDFLDVMIYFILGVAVASIFGTAVNQEIFLPLALNDWLAVPSMMTLAGVLSLCSSSDAFIAATFVAFPAVAKLAFLVFGPMMDLKLLFIYSAVFTKRFVVGLAVGLFILIGLLCVRLSVIGL